MCPRQTKSRHSKRKNASALRLKKPQSPVSNVNNAPLLRNESKNTDSLISSASDSLQDVFKSNETLENNEIFRENINIEKEFTGKPPLVDEVPSFSIDDLKKTNTSVNMTKNENENEKDLNKSYCITTTYKTEIIERTIDPETGDTIETITEIYVTDVLDLNQYNLPKLEIPIIPNSNTLDTKEKEDVNEEINEEIKEMEVDSKEELTKDLEEVFRQLTRGTEICKGLLG